MARFCLRCCLLSVALLCISCATSQYDLGMKFSEQGNYSEALNAFRMAYRENPKDLYSIRELGVVCYRMAKYDRSEKILNLVASKLPEDGRTLFYLGATFEKSGHLKDAINAYTRYVDSSGWSDAKEQVKAKLDVMIREQIEQESQKLLAMEASLDLSDIPDNTIAVLNFKNIGNKSKLDPLEKGITDMLITDLSKVESLQVVERIRMQKMMEEMNLAQTGLMDASTAPRVGKLLGVTTLVNGSFVDMPDHKVRLDAGLVDTKTQTTITSDNITSDLVEIFKAEKKLVFDVIDQLAIELTGAERDAIQQLPTENIFAFMSYCQGLDFEDKGLFDQANSMFSKAVQIDPGFMQAQQQLDVTREVVSGGTELSSLEKKVDQSGNKNQLAQTQVSRKIKPGSTQSLTTQNLTETMENTTVDQMLHTAQVLDRGFLPGIDSRNTESEQSQTTFGSSADILVEIPIPTSLR